MRASARWLEQFTDEERVIAYNFLRKKLIYISAAEMSNLVITCYPDIIRPFLIKQIASQKGIPEWQVVKITESLEFKLVLRQSMFLGLSDGSRIDVFRRGSPIISHEQILRTHEINNTRAADMLENLKTDLTKILGRHPTNDELHFRNVFLLDDFSGSGVSYIRKDGTGFKGKIASFYNDQCSQSDSGAARLVNPEDVHVCMVLYMATKQAHNYLKNLGKELFNKIPFEVRVINSLSGDSKLKEPDDQAFISLLKKYYDPSIETKSYLRGKHEKPYLGFDECALPLVLSHNTPNNSVTLLWFEEDRKFRGLFLE